MKETVILTKDKYPLLQLFGYVWIIFIAISDYTRFEHPFILTLAIIIQFFLFYFSLYRADIVLTETELIKGDKLPFFKKRFHLEQIKRKDYAELKLTQNAKKYFVINAVDSKNKSILLEILPNKKPAEKKLLEIEDVIHQVWK